MRCLLVLACLLSGCASHHAMELARVPCPVSLPLDFSLDDQPMTAYTVRAAAAESQFCSIVLFREANRCLVYYEISSGAGGGVRLQPTDVRCPK